MFTSNYIDCSTMFPDSTDFNAMPGMANCSNSSVSSSSSVSDSSQSASSGSQKKKCKKPDKTKTPLPLDFEPTSHTILCGRSRECYEWVGNRRFRIICNMYLQQYLDAPGKLEKSRIVTTVMKSIRQGNKVGVFVTYEGGRYYEVSQRTAREKVGGFFRDSLPAEYRSSAKAKLARKRAETTGSPTSSMPTLPLTEIFAPQQVESGLEELETLEESPDFLTGGVFANDPLPIMMPSIGNDNSFNNNNNNSQQCDFLGATFFDVDCL